MRRTCISAILLGAFTLVMFAGIATGASMGLEISEAARAEIAEMGDVAYLSIQEIGSG